MANSKFSVCLLKIIRNIGDKVRCLEEGKATVNAEDIICCGVRVKSEDIMPNSSSTMLYMLTKF